MDNEREFQIGDFVQSPLDPMWSTGFIVGFAAPVATPRLRGAIVRLATGREIWIGLTELRLIAPVEDYENDK